MRLFLDANVIVTAAHSPRGRSAALFDLARRGRCRLSTSAHPAAEAERNLGLKYPAASGRLAALMGELAMEPEAAAADVSWALTQGLPSTDAPVLAAAVASSADALVTGDRTHFGHLFGCTVRGVKVLPPVDALALVLARR